MTKDIPSVRRHFKPFSEWLRENHGAEKTTGMSDAKVSETILKYLKANNLLDCEIKSFEGKNSIIRFRLEEKREFWHECTWSAFLHRSGRNYETEFDSTLIKEPYIKWYMEQRGTPALKIEKRAGERYWVYFFSPRYKWICCQHFKDIKRYGNDEKGNITHIGESDWKHKFDSICGKKEYIENLLWSKYQVIADEDFEYMGMNARINGKLTAQSVSGTSFDGFRYSLSLPGLLQGKPESELSISSAEKKTDYIRECLSRLGCMETGKPYELDAEFTINDGRAKGKRIPFWYESNEWGREKYAITWRTDIETKIRNTDSTKVDTNDLRIESKNEIPRRVTIRYAWNKTELIRNRFKSCNYIIPESWSYGESVDEDSKKYKSTEKVPIPFIWKNKWHRINWNYFSAGLRVDVEKLLYFIKIKWRGNEYKKTGITKDSAEVRFANHEYEVVEIYMTTERRPEAQIKEVEDILLFSTRKYAIQDNSLSEMNGGTECRTLELDESKIKLLIAKASTDIENKWQNIGKNQQQIP